MRFWKLALIVSAAAQQVSLDGSERKEGGKNQNYQLYQIDVLYNWREVFSASLRQSDYLSLAALFFVCAVFDGFDSLFDFDCILYFDVCALLYFLS